MLYKIIFFLLCAHSVSCTKPTPSRLDESGKQEGLKIEDLKEGEGRAAESNKSLKVHYTGKLPSGEVFDTSHTRNRAFEFTLGKGQVIDGWEIGIRGMKVGGKRVLTIPPHLAYGSRGVGNTIPPNTILTFEIELLWVEPSP